MEFSSLLDDSLLAIGYALESQFGALMDAPMLALIFENESAGRTCFARLVRENGVRVLRLETNRALEEAIGLYRAAGFAEVAQFNDEPYAHHWFEKELS
jgi:hypothetical protein